MHQGGNQVSSIFDTNWVTGQSQSGLWFGKTDDLWGFGKPQGWGGPWRYDAVRAGEPSDPYLMTGFDKKVAHFRVDPPSPAFASKRGRSASARAAGLLPRGGAAPAAWPAQVTIAIQVDFDGAAGHGGARGYSVEPWNTLARVVVGGNSTLSENYAHFVFPQGFSAHWVRFVADADANITAWLTYT